MKKTILITTILSLNIISTSAGDYGINPIDYGSIAYKPIFDPCDLIKRNGEKDNKNLWNNFALNTNNPVTIDLTQMKKQTIITKIMDHLSNIIDLKGKVTTFLEENRETYGRYTSLKEQKVLLEDRILRLEADRKELNSEAQKSFASISPGHSNRKIRKIIDAIQEQLNRDLSRIDKTLNPSKDKRIQVEDEYFEVYSRWAPYQEYLSQLENLETNLIKSLKTLKEIENSS
ncbi:MAG: hypothetical protein NXH75_06580, partial [Halobacteriovoraceae bacterium]|nr:hypothetical protein [Halobacteriovoraceae bacterium]